MYAKSSRSLQELTVKFLSLLFGWWLVGVLEVFFVWFGFIFQHYLNYLPELKQTQQCNCQNYLAISFTSYKSEPLTKAERMHNIFIQATQQSTLLGEKKTTNHLRGQKILLLNFFSSKFGGWSQNLKN